MCVQFQVQCQCPSCMSGYIHSWALGLDSNLINVLKQDLGSLSTPDSGGDTTALSGTVAEIQKRT